MIPPTFYKAESVLHPIAIDFARINIKYFYRLYGIVLAMASDKKTKTNEL